MDLKDRQEVFSVSEKQVITILASVFLITLSGIVLIDILDVFGIRTFLFNSDWGTPFFWYHWYRNGGPIEFVQYSFLGFAALYSVRNSQHGLTVNKKFWGVFSIALLYLLIEDAGDPRHFIRYYVQQAAGETDGQGFWGTMTELVYFTVLGSIPLYAYWRYGRVALKDYMRTKSYLIGGFLFYGLAASASFLGSAFSTLINRDLYTFLGNNIISLIVFLGGPEVESAYMGDNYNSISFYIMDSPIEESIELIGAALLLLAAVSFIKKKNIENDHWIENSN